MYDRNKIQFNTFPSTRFLSAGDEPLWFQFITFEQANREFQFITGGNNITLNEYFLCPTIRQKMTGIEVPPL